MWIVTELQPTDLGKFIAQVRDELRLDGVVLVGLDIADGLSYLHGEGIVHRDLKPKNILVGPGGAKLADLGTAKVIGVAARTALHTVGPGTAIYHPPEAGEGRYSAKIDVFSLGLTLMQLGLVGALSAFYVLAWGLSSLAVSSYFARVIAIAAAAGVMHF